MLYLFAHFCLLRRYIHCVWIKTYIQNSYFYVNYVIMSMNERRNSNATSRTIAEINNVIIL